MNWLKFFLLFSVPFFVVAFAAWYWRLFVVALLLIALGYLLEVSKRT